ncbi:Uncharacterised protein [Bordetella pertussis]|nr:Uncharacterised protein [Bordetella pertussis]CFL77945.1 Uncharacterised protein [Bordetella pertussis]CFL99519.1 Uncharacterised protein [Bordetella pertussis]CFM88986.1 Uncharacterised protein [Bordetella pertussis]CFN08235.1 Uncharacterised protein [Bordetella pertussis]
MAARNQVGRQFQLAARHLALDQLLDVEQIALFVGGEQGDRLARRAGAAGAADPVDIVFGVVRQVVVDDAGHAGHVQAARRDVGRHQHFQIAGLERLERLHAVALGLVAVDRLGLHAVTLELARQPRGADLGVGKHDDLLQAARLDQVHHRRPLGIAMHLVGDLRDGVGRGVARGDFDLHRVVQVRTAQLADFIAERGREQQPLALRRQQADDAFEIGQKAHVEHAVGLVEHQDADLAEVDVLLLDVIEQAPRRGHQDFATAPQGFLLRTDVHAAEHHGAAQRRMQAVALDAFVNLVGQFPRGRENEGPHRVARRRCAGIGQRHQAMQDRQRECRRLAGAGLGGAHHIAAFHYDRNRLRLNRRGIRIAGVGNQLEQ